MPDVCDLSPLCWAGKEVTKQASPMLWKQLEDWLAQGAASSVRLAVAGWVSVPSPEVSANNGSVAYLTAYTRPFTYVLFAIALMVQAGQLALSQRGEDLREIMRGILQFVVLSGGGVAVVALLTSVGDTYSNWILTEATTGANGATMGDRIVTLLGITSSGTVAPPGVAGPILALLAFMTAVTGVIQILLVYARAIVLLLLCGLLPLAAAAAMTRRGRAVLDRYLAWMLAWVLYKPVAASIYAGAFFMMGTGGALNFIAGMGAIIMAVFALPAMMRLINPLVAGMGGTGMGVGTGGGMIGGAIADGAVKLAGQIGSSSTAGGGGSGSGTVRDATHGSHPSGSVPPGSGSDGSQRSGAQQAAPAGTPSSGQSSGDSSQGASPAANSSPGAASAGASSAGASSAGASSAGASSAGASSAGAAAGGPWLLAADAAKKAATAPARGAKKLTDEATGGDQS